MTRPSIEPHFAGGRAFLKKQHHGFHACTEEGAAGAVEHGVEVAAALDLVADLAEDFADLVFDGVRPAGALLEGVRPDGSQKC
jgi:uncharacterized protein with PhoU and TrkA domain